MQFYRTPLVPPHNDLPANTDANLVLIKELSIMLKGLRLLLLFPFLYGCGKPGTIKVASENGFESYYIDTDDFSLASFVRFKKVGEPLTVYIEGDGYGFSRNGISVDPSPRSSTVMELAALDPHDNVAYLARPCQYSPGDLATVCDSKYWSYARYSEPVVNSLNQAIAKLKRRIKAREINLIGYSGGGALAILIASRRHDISSIRTVAGNLDLKAMDQHHHTPPLHESLDPLSFASSVQHIPQLHFVGADDKIVPKQVAFNFAKAAKLPNNSVIILPKVTHNKGWNKRWLQLLALKQD